jgi:hypothetical protein
MIMVRRDGFPTNTEMIVDFDTTAHEVFVDAFKKELGRKCAFRIAAKALEEYLPNP